MLVQFLTLWVTRHESALKRQLRIPANVSIHFMNNTDKRLQIFKRFSENLKFLKKNAIISKDIGDEPIYICPICLGRFTFESLDQNSDNPLTLEDVPPKSLGGKANILTCRICNNKSGHFLEPHLKDYLVELDKHQFVPNSEFYVQIEKDGKTVQGKIFAQEDGSLKIIHYAEKNNPIVLEQFIESVKSSVSRLVNILFYPKKISKQALDIAFLKIGYLKAFEKYGYAFILNSEYDIIRQQIMNPEEKLYKVQLLIDLPELKGIVGVPFIIEKNLEVILPSFELKTIFRTHHFSIFVPLTKKPTEEIYNELIKRINLYKKYPFKLDPMGPNIDYLTDLQGIKKMINWIENLKNVC
jgi:hypothetical protein